MLILFLNTRELSQEPQNYYYMCTFICAQLNAYILIVIPSDHQAATVTFYDSLKFFGMWVKLLVLAEKQNKTKQNKNKDPSKKKILSVAFYSLSIVHGQV